METLKHCPLCRSEGQKQLLSTCDFTLSGERFGIAECTSCGFAFTNPRPDSHELGKYYEGEAYISHSDTQRGLKNRLYHLARGSALKRKIAQISRLCGPKKGRLLDVGCGTGYFLQAAVLDGWEGEGIEPDSGAAEQAGRRSGCRVYPESRLDQLPEGSFDLITLWHVMEHVPEPGHRAAQLMRLLKPGGILVVAVPNRQSFDAERYGEFWAAWDVPRHLNHFRPADMDRLLLSAGFRKKGMRGMPLDAFYISLLSEQYRGSGLAGYLRAFVNGLRSNLKARRSAEGRWSSMEYYFQKP